MNNRVVIKRVNLSPSLIIYGILLRTIENVDFLALRIKLLHFVDELTIQKEYSPISSFRSLSDGDPLKSHKLAFWIKKIYKKFFLHFFVIHKFVFSCAYPYMVCLSGVYSIKEFVLREIVLHEFVFYEFIFYEFVF